MVMQWIWRRIYPQEDVVDEASRSLRLRSFSSSHRPSLEGISVDGYVLKSAPSPLVLPGDKHSWVEQDDSPEAEIERLRKENSKLWTIVDTHYVKAACETAGLLDRRMHEVWKATERANLSSVLFTSTPCTTAISKPFFQYLVLLMSISCLGMGIENTTRLAYATTQLGFTASRFKFVPLELRDGTIGDDISSPSIASFGLYHDKCLIPTKHATYVQQGRELHLNFSQPVYMNGWVLHTAGEQPEKDPVRFKLWCLDEKDPVPGGEEESWVQCGSAMHRYNMWLKLKFHDTARADLPVSRFAKQNYDFRPDWMVWLNTLARATLHFVGFFLMFMSAQIGHPRAAKWILIAQFMLLSLLTIIIAIGYVYSDQMDSSSVWFSESIGNLIIPAVLLINESALIQAFLGFGAYQAVVMTLVIKLVGQYNYMDVVSSAASGCVMIGVVALFKIARHNMLRKSRKMIQPDKRVYDEVWSCIVAEDEPVGALRRLQEIVDDLQPHKAWTCRHLNRKVVFESAGNTHHGGGIGLPGTVDPHRPVTSLDQLYAQAVAIDIVLLRKVQVWAREGLFPSSEPDKSLQRVLSAGSAGSAPSRPSPRFIKWEHAKTDESLINSIKWGRIKRPERAVEKAVRTYKNDVSRLVDIVRQSIVFDNVDKLSEALKGVVNDDDVCVERIKNRLDVRYDSWASAGYRDVVLNLRIVTPETKRLGVDTHVCELQLIMKEFAELKHEAGHSRYVEFRNLRGE